MDTATRQLYIDHFGIDPTGPVLPNTITQGNGILDPRQFYFDAYRAEKNKGLTVRVQAAPIFAPTQVDSVFYMEDCYNA
jgi:hypothetical protein